MLTIGQTKGKIVSHSLDTLTTKQGDRDIVRINVEIDGDPAQALIWLTPKAIGIARAQLRKCGFDIDRQDLTVLEDNHTLLAGNVIPVEIEDYQGKLQVRVMAKEPVNRKRMADITSALRSAKQDGEHAIEEEDIPF